MNDALPPRTHNQPSLIERVHDLVRAANEGTASTPVIKDEETAGRFQGFIQQLRDARAELEAAKKRESKPHDDALYVIRLSYKDPFDLIELAHIRVQPLVDDWLQRLKVKVDDDAQRRREHAAALQAEADRLHAIADEHDDIEARLRAIRAQEAADAARALAEKPVERAAIRGEFAPRAMSLRTRWAARIVDEEKALAHFIKHPEVRGAALGAILKVARRLAVQFKDQDVQPPGVEFTKSEKAQ